MRMEMSPKLEMLRGASDAIAPGRLGLRQWAAATVAGALVGAVRARNHIGLGPRAATACAFLCPAAIAAGFRRSRTRDAVVWAAQMWAYKNAFELPNDDTERLRRRAHLDYPIALDSRLGVGMPPSQRLQRLLRRRGELSLLDKGVSMFYWTWEAEPHLALMWIRCADPERFAAAAGRLAATFNLTLLGYWSVPTAPPWWSSEKAGRMGGEVRRVMSEVARWIKGEPNPTEGDHELGANPFAAMPSDHFASAAMTAIILAELDPRLGAFGWCYALLLAVASRVSGRALPRRSSRWPRFGPDGQPRKAAARATG
jgi:hypothetical protein